MLVALTGPLALFILDIFFLGFFRLIFQFLERRPGRTRDRLWQHAKITFAVQLGLLLLVLALASGLDLNSLPATKFFAFVLFSSSFVVPLTLQIRRYWHTRP